MPEVIKLQNDLLSIEADPDRGGSLRSFQFRRRDGSWIDIFQNVNKAPAGSWGYFPMLPYTARLFNGVFPWKGSFFSVTPVKNSQHAIHGPGRQHRWKVLERGPDDVVLELRSADHRETFAYTSDLEIILRYAIDENTLHVITEITNVGEEDAPIGGGSHPFVPKRLAGCKRGPVLEFSADRRYLPREDTPGEAMPDGRTEKMTGTLSFERPRTPEEGWDHCLGGWKKTAKARWEEIGICLTFEDLDPDSEGFAHLWYPEGRDVWAFEQQLAIGNAFNLAPLGIPTGMQILNSGESTGFRHAFSISEF